LVWFAVGAGVRRKRGIAWMRESRDEVEVEYANRGRCYTGGLIWSEEWIWIPVFEVGELEDLYGWGGE
jgi:hypothetical protein